MSEPKNESRGKKSRYQKKLRRKFGKGAIDPRWMWWLERPEAKAGGAR